MAKQRVAPHIYTPWVSGFLEMVLESQNGAEYTLLLGFGTRSVTLTCARNCRVSFLFLF